MTRSVLLVDPDSARQKRIGHSLEGTDFRLSAAAGDSEGGLRLAAMFHPDVALVGTALWDGPGLQVTERLPKEYNVPVVLLASGSLEPPAVKLAAHTGIMGFVIEPIQAAALRATLEVAVCRFQELRALQEEGEALRQTVEARKVIERAKGLLMEVGRISEAEAYARIRRKSMDTQRPMAEIAHAILLSADMSLKAR